MACIGVEIDRERGGEREVFVEEGEAGIWSTGEEMDSEVLSLIHI